MLDIYNYIKDLKYRIIDCNGIIEQRTKELDLEKDPLVRHYIIESINDWKKLKYEYEEILKNIENIDQR